MEKKDYKNTLNMPQTDFSMKANLSEKEPQFKKFWDDKKIYQEVLKKNKNNKPFILHDGPPYANGPLHLGHALNKIIKDIIVRYKSMSGFYSPFVPGWDTHGLPIENKILEKMNIKNHKEITSFDLRKQAEKYALEQIEIQKSQFQKLQLLCDFNDYYKTLDKSFEVKQLKLFKKLCLDGLIYRGLKPVYWSPSSQSALAEAEVEYFDHRSPSIYVRFIVTKGNEHVNEGDSLIIWTTTPWTLIANSGVAINKEFKYSIIEHDNEKYIVATELVEKIIEDFKWENIKIISTIKGNDLIDLEYKSPINNNICPVVDGHHVTLDAGTGLVHIAPLFGEDDYLIGKKNNLEMIMHINDDGTINEESKEYSGIFYEDANKLIGEFLEKNNLLINLKFIKHSYPHDWRTKKPIIFRGTPQWFVSINKIKDNILSELKKVKFYSEWGYKRLSTMIQNREDWTISRQRSWGVPLIIFYDENKQPIMNEKIFDHVIQLVEKEGTNVWYQKEVDDLLPKEFRNKNWTKENDIMDVWFDSGSSFMAVNVDNIEPPFDLYFEGSDQYRGWFNSSLINSVAYSKKAPYKELLSHGFLVDEKGKKMSKSLGNGIDPMDVINELGADILRLWIANSEYSKDITISKNILQQTTEMYRKIRNIIRFLLSNLNDFDYSKNGIKKIEGVHLLIQERLNNLKINIKEYYDEYSFLNVIKSINNFIVDLSSFYLSITKDILYVKKQDDEQRRMVQTVFYEILDFLIISLAPILPTTCEEAYQLFNKHNKLISVHLENFENIINTKEVSNVEENKWKDFFELKDNIYKIIEQKIQQGAIKRTNESFVKLNVKNDFLKSLDLKMLLMIGKIEFVDNLKEIEIYSFDSIKCQRCWNHFENNEIKDDLCNYCYLVINN